MKTWQLQDAKAKLSELIREVIHSGPRGISLRGLLEVIIISKNDYEKLTRKKSSFMDFMKNSPMKGLELNLERNKSQNRDIEL